MLGTTTTATLGEHVAQTAPTLVLLLGWSGAWAFAAAAIAGASSLSRHLRIASAGLVATALWGTVVRHVDFVLALDSPPEVLEIAGTMALLRVVLDRHLRWTAGRSPRW